jgi:hypothetical protein
MNHDALIAKKGRFGWRWCVVPIGLVKSFRAQGWIKILDTDDMADTRDEIDIQATRLADEQRNPNRANRWWGKRPQCNDE